MKKIIISLVLLLALVACGGNGEKEDEVVIAYTAQTLSNPYFVTLAEGLEDYAEEKGIEVTVADGDQDAAKQINQVETFISQKVDAIVITPTNDKALEDVVEKAKEAGIAVLAANQNIEGVDAFITVPEYEFGYTIGEVAGDWINDKLNGEADVLVLDYPEIEAIIARGDGIREGILEKAPEANIVSSISANTPEKGMAAMESIMQQYPDVKVVVGVNDAGVLGAYEAVYAADKESDDFFMGGLDATDQALENIEKDTILRATVDIDPYGTGKLIVDTALDVIENGPIDEVIKINMIPVTKENVSEFLD